VNSISRRIFPYWHTSGSGKRQSLRFATEICLGTHPPLRHSCAGRRYVHPRRHSCTRRPLRPPPASFLHAPPSRPSPASFLHAPPSRPSPGVIPVHAAVTSIPGVIPAHAAVTSTTASFLYTPPLRPPRRHSCEGRNLNANFFLLGSYHCCQLRGNTIKTYLIREG